MWNINVSAAVRGCGANDDNGDKFRNVCHITRSLAQRNIRKYLMTFTLDYNDFHTELTLYLQFYLNFLNGFIFSFLFMGQELGRNYFCLLGKDFDFF